MTITIIKMIVVGLIVSAYHNNFGSHMWNIGFDLPDNMLNICKWCLGFTHSANKNYVTVCFTDSCPVRTSTRRRLPAQRTALIEPLRSLLQTLTLAHHLTTFIQTPHHQLHNHHQLHHRVQCFIWQEVDIGYEPWESNSFPFAATPGMSDPTPSA